MFGSQAVVGESSIRICCPVDQVFSFIADNFERNYPRWSPEVQQLQVMSAGALDEDWFARQTRIDEGHKTVSTFRVACFERPQRVVFSGVSSEFTCSYILETPGSQADEALACFRFEIPRLELRLRPFRKLIQISVQEGAERTVRNLKGLIEQESNSVSR